MPELIQNCPLCGSDRNRLFDQRTFHGAPVTNRLCLNCGLVYQSPRMTTVEAEEFYAAEYRRMYQGDEDPIAKDLAVQRARAASLLSFTRPFVDAIHRHLDIGCSAGLLLQQFQQAYRTQPVGVEPGDAYRTYACAQGLVVYASLDELKAADTPPSDLVSLSHVLEHLPNPVTYLADLRQGILASNGWLLVEVPNLYAHDSFETAHLFSFSARTLTGILHQAGYEIVRLEAHGRPRSTLVPYYLTVLAHPSEDPRRVPSLRRESGVTLKRRLGLLRRSILSRLAPKKAWGDV